MNVRYTKHPLGLRLGRPPDKPKPAVFVNPDEDYRTLTTGEIDKKDFDQFCQEMREKRSKPSITLS
ncbi:MAG: hypothetical protein CEN88_319 [Candidatus Berkelbacteria bacterium Licking1014_2]|uniref:Uncharacterized protein n=1 Tax=Candidatus Berkelbacteria bacterium Licking1014_2 TaxID=2017146 RepID=A0A554LUL5_9BACT|nr:MAG: hypothetical protein CEN88_319 [Candidatus Berkelbacteria bacterium Licking1014_2]